jgi:RNA polymerase sigma-70 factor (ECF subfamily)
MKMNQCTQPGGDEHWIEQYRLGNQDSLDVLYKRYFKKVYYTCMSMCKDPDQAYDLAQDALLKAFENLPSFKGHSSFSTWLYTITYNHCCEFFRKSKRLVVHRLEYFNKDDVEDIPGPLLEEASLQAFAESRMMALLDTIPETEKKMLFLKYYEGRSIEYLQTVFMLSASAVKMRLKRAKRKLNVLYAKMAA